MRSRESMKTCDWTRGEWMLSSMLEAEKGIDPVQGKAIDEAVKDYLTDWKTRSLEPSTIRSYLNTLQAFAAFCDQRRCFGAKDISVDLITAFRSDSAFLTIGLYDDFRSDGNKLYDQQKDGSEQGVRRAHD